MTTAQKVAAMHKVMNHLNIIHSALNIMPYGHHLALPTLEQYESLTVKEILRIKALWVDSAEKCPASDSPTYMKHQKQTADLREQYLDLYAKTLTSVKTELEAFIGGIEVPPKYLKLETPIVF